MRRCYMNPNGSVANPDPASGAPRLTFSQFRPYFTRSGFDVIDCPSLTKGSKNAADIRMVLDAMDALGESTRYDEFVIASGDSDLTPLLVRLRAADRRTTIVSPFDAAEAFTAIADRLIDGQQTLELLQDDNGEDPQDQSNVSGTPERSGETANSPEEVARARARFKTLVAKRYRAAKTPLHLGSLGQEIRDELGPSTDGTRWFGQGAFKQALEGLHLPGLVISGQFLWDSTRHEAPPAASTPSLPGIPEPVARLCALTNLPRLPRSSWRPVYEVLAQYPSDHAEFNLAEATKWSRDRLADRGVSLGRQSIGFITRGANYGGVPLYRQPPPSPDEIADAFVNNVQDRADSAAIELSDKEVTVVTDWLLGGTRTESTTAH